MYWNRRGQTGSKEIPTVGSFSFFFRFLSSVFCFDKKLVLTLKKTIELQLITSILTTCLMHKTSIVK